MKRQTRKDWRKRSWPSGTNSKGAKLTARRLLRRKARKLSKSDMDHIQALALTQPEERLSYLEEYL